MKKRDKRRRVKARKAVSRKAAKNAKENLGAGICDGCGQHKPALIPIDGAPLAGGALCRDCYGPVQEWHFDEREGVVVTKP